MRLQYLYFSDCHDRTCAFLIVMTVLVLFFLIDCHNSTCDFLIACHDSTCDFLIDCHSHKPLAPSLAVDPTFGIHSHKTLDTAQPCHLLKPNRKPSSSHSIFILI